MPQKKLNIHRFLTRKIITVDSKKFTSMLNAAKEDRFTTEYRAVCVRESRPLSDWTTDPEEADRIANEHRRQHKHATTVQIRN